LLLGPPPGTKCHLFSSNGSRHLFHCTFSPAPAASPGRGYLGPRAAGPVFARSGQSGCVGAGVGPWARGATRPASYRPLRLTPLCWWPAPPRWPRSCWRPTGERPKDSRRARPRQRSSPASSSNRGADNNHYFFKIDVGFPGQVWSSQVREAKSRCQVKRAGRLRLSAPRFAARVPALRGVMRWDRRSSFSGKGGGRTMDGIRARGRQKGNSVT